ncbi:unnamed protein product [Haemonchus placei]|uniref:PARP catalytic domain-containing protein n=1 Tax=Haemonchus placei TaxID=6290 RepID=A0A0N4WND4_HAEPC|nr:unnamed protein product [Haemonchus placei]
MAAFIVDNLARERASDLGRRLPAISTKARTCNYNSHEMNFFSIFLSLVTFINLMESAKFKFYVWRDTQKCAAGTSPRKSSLRIRRVYSVFFDKRTRQILKIKRYRHHPHDAIVSLLNEEYNGDMTNVGLGIYLGFARSKEFRSNESPTTNHKLEKDISDDRIPLVKPGTGSDFSEMYHDAPVMLKIHFVEVKKTGAEENYALFVANSCSESKKWIANEGYYRLDTNNGEFIPIYYDPIESDFYY